MNRFISCAVLALFVAATPVKLSAQVTPAADPPVPSAQTGMPDVTGSLPPAKPIEGQIVAQDRNTILVSSIIGSEVQSTDNTVVGSVNDLIMTPDGKIDGVVVGVGGFLGFGEKQVALGMSRFTVEPIDSSTAAKLVLNVSKDALLAAPAFKSAYMQRVQEESTQQMLTQLNEKYPHDDSLQIPMK